MFTMSGVLYQVFFFFFLLQLALLVPHREPKLPLQLADCMEMGLPQRPQRPI